ncbi:uncharacterized protein LOC127853233 isoform X2 [Dreissena polymorpha]|uniref:uncharacterized protein LOC127853233 isoform X2 n=1 Tax=Dreissena polymorpha TaxID=45954 RepID=UPI00226465CE|nr:uncharacterized protein LOC127853233 isoform X2 [Dreissena polymorpha]
MRLQILMATVRKGAVGVGERVPSAGSRQKPLGNPVRAIHPNSSPVYKTQSDTALAAGLQRLSLKDGKTSGTPRRLLSSRAGTNAAVKSVSDAARLLATEGVKNVVVVAGAGISTPSGIPDFRSPGTGLYDNLQQYKIPYPEAIFDIDYFHVNPRPFFTLAKELYPSGKYRPNYIHYFVRLLHDKGLLLRMYTQNIDGMERLAGLPEDKVVEAHGTFATATCTNCRQTVQGSEIKEKIFTDKLPRCSTRGCVGIMKPDIVFFGEDLPRKFYSYMKDMLQSDMVIVMGTSLEVQPFAGIIDTVRQSVPRILFNREAVGPFRYNGRPQDVVAAGDLIEEMVKFAGQVGWTQDMVELITRQEGTFTILNKKPPPAPPSSQTRNYSTQANRNRQTFTLYTEDSSSEESTESESDVTSSESSEEDNERIFRGNNHRKKYVSNNKNALLQSSSSAKSNDGNKRNVHSLSTQRIAKPNSVTLAGNMSGRSIKSESVISDKIKSNMKKPPLPKETRTVMTEVKAAFHEINNEKSDQLKTEKQSDLNTHKTNINDKSEERFATSKVLRLKQANYISESEIKAEQVQNNDMLEKTEDKRTKKTKGKHSVTLLNKDNLFQKTNDVYEQSQSENEINKPSTHHLNEVTALEQGTCKTEQESNENTGKVVEEFENNNFFNGKGKLNEKIQHEGKIGLMSERTAILMKYGLNPIPLTKKENSFSNNRSMKSKSVILQEEIKKVRSDSAISSGYYVEDVPQSESSNGPDIPAVARIIREKPIPVVEPFVRHNKSSDNLSSAQKTWQENVVFTDDMFPIVNDITQLKSRSYAQSIPGSVGSSNSNDKGSKVLSERTARSFEKYANLASHKKKKRRGKKHGKSRITLKDRPSPGAMDKQKKPDLNSVNAVPYGYSRRQSNKVKGIGPFHRTNVRTLSSSIDYKAHDVFRSGSADIPKISYRHKIDKTPSSPSCNYLVPESGSGLSTPTD